MASGPRQGHAVVTQLEHRGDRQVAAGGVAAGGDVPGLEAACKQLPVDGRRVFDLGREGVFGYLPGAKCACCLLMGLDRGMPIFETETLGVFVLNGCNESFVQNCGRPCPGDGFALLEVARGLRATGRALASSRRSLPPRARGLGLLSSWGKVRMAVWRVPRAGR